ncbi:MAG: hypothetical protein IJA80_00785 [Clostridia bacterium]|nr:hypothetical protein [Clostridia bacterium]
MNKYLAKLISVILIVTMMISILPLQFNVSATSVGSHSHPICGDGSACGGEHTNVSWTPISTDTTTLSSGYYYLESRIGFASVRRLVIEGDVSICLNGYELYCNGNSSVIDVKSGTLTICDCVGTGEIISDNRDDTSFSGGGTICVENDASLIMYGGNVKCGGEAYNECGLGAGIYCNTTGSVQIYGGKINTKKGSGIDIYKVKDLSIYNVEINSTNDYGIDCDYGTFHNIDIKDGSITGRDGGLHFGRFTCTGKVVISGGTFNGQGPVPNATTYSADYYGVSFATSNGGSCNMTITGGIFKGARGGLYSYNPNLNLIINNGVFECWGSGGSDAIRLQDANSLQIKGGKIHGLTCEGPSDVIVTGGQILSMYLSDSDGKISVDIYGGIIGRVDSQTASWGIQTNYMSTVRVFGGLIEGTKSGFHSYGFSDQTGIFNLQISGGVITGGTSDIDFSKATTTPSEAYISLLNYSGSPLSVKLNGSESFEGLYVAKNVANDGLLTLSSDEYSLKYESQNQAVKIIGLCKHANCSLYNKKESTCSNEGYTGDIYCLDCEALIESGTTIPKLNHTEIIVKGKDATCTSTGLTDGKKCSVCDEVLLLQDTIPVKEHAYDLVVTKPTCTDNGFTTYVCNCGESYVDDYVDATGHSCTPEITKLATHTETGAMTFTCTCGYSYTETIAKTTEHSYTKIVTVPTCTERGYTTYTCECGDSYIQDYVSAIGHAYSENIINPTCTEQGYTTYTCACGYSYVGNYVNSTGHNYKSVITAPTCTEKGYTTYTCECGYSYVANYVNPLGHKYESVVTAPTCTEQGYTTFTCACGDSYVGNYVIAKGHDYASVVTTPTCTEQGYTTYTCACGDSYVVNYVNAKGHDYTSKVTTPATHLATGVMTYTCECSDTYTEVIAKTTEHTYTAVTTAPTCDAKGYTTYTCACGDAYIDNYVDATGHNANGDDVCDNCGETVEVENPSDNCSCNCHKSGISKFFFNFILFFQRLFGANKTCACGVAHY